MKKYKKIIYSLIFMTYLVNLEGCSLKLNFDGNIIENKFKITESEENQGRDYKGEKALPLGTIVSLKDSDEKLVIAGWMQIIREGSDKHIYDYIGSVYPIGTLNKKYTKVFDEEEIDKIYFDGYIDEEGIEFRKRVIEYGNDNKNKNDTFEQMNQVLSNTTKDNTYNEGDFLPLGSIVKVKGKDSRYIILGRLMRDDDDILFDYYGCEYPGGSMTLDDELLFNSDKIEKVSFYGYKDSEEIEQNKEMIEYKELNKN